METRKSLGIIALVPGTRSGIVMPRHQVVRRLANYVPSGMGRAGAQLA